METSDIKSHMSWVVPAIVTICVVIYHLMYAVKTAQKFDRMLAEDTVIMAEFDARLDRIEEFCCSEICKFKKEYGDSKYSSSKEFLKRRLDVK